MEYATLGEDELPGTGSVQLEIYITCQRCCRGIHGSDKG